MNKIITFVLFIAFTFSTAVASSFTSKEERALDISTITNCIHDTFYKVSRDFLKDNGLITDGTSLIDSKEAERLATLAENADYPEIYSEAGGSTGNSVVTLKNLGLDVCLIGTLADDPLAESYKSSLEKKDILYRPVPPQQNELGSGTCTIFISKNENGGFDRAMYTSLGVSGDIQLSPENIEEAGKAKCFLAEGYSFNNATPRTSDSVRSVAAKTIANDNLVALTLSADFCVEFFLTQIQAFITDYASIVIGNESEAKILTHTEDALSAVKRLKAQGKRGAITCGSRGAYAYDATGIYFISCPNVDPTAVVDPTGAGDVFAAGLIYGLLAGKSIVEAGQIAALCAGEVIKVYGGHTHTSLAEIVSSGAATSISFEKIEDNPFINSAL